jgi:ABC-type nitrate/sulfonate/bicarbonate transport system substrate-binding protein
MSRRVFDPATGRRAFCVSLGAGLTILSIPRLAGGAVLPKLPTATGIDAVFSPFVVAVERKIFEKYGLEGSYKPFDDGNVALDALLTGSSDIGSSSELAGLARWDKGGKLYVTAVMGTSREQIGIAASEEIRKPEDLIGKTVGYPRASGAHYFFGRYVKRYRLPVDQIKVKILQAPEMVAALEHRDIDAYFLWEPWLTKAVELVKGAHVLARSGDDDVWVLVSYIYFSEGLVNDPPRAMSAIRTMIEATDYCANQRDDAAKIAAKAFRLPEADMKLYMSRFKYRMEMPTQLVVNNFKEATGFATEQALIKKIPDWSDFIWPQFMKEAAPDRTTG